MNGKKSSFFIQSHWRFRAIDVDFVNFPKLHELICYINDFLQNFTPHTLVASINNSQINTIPIVIILTFLHWFLSINFYLRSLSHSMPHCNFNGRGIAWNNNKRRISCDVEEGILSFYVSILTVLYCRIKFFDVFNNLNCFHQILDWVEEDMGMSNTRDDFFKF